MTVTKPDLGPQMGAQHLGTDSCKKQTRGKSSNRITQDGTITLIRGEWSKAPRNGISRNNQPPHPTLASSHTKHKMTLFAFDVSEANPTIVLTITVMIFLICFLFLVFML